MPLTSEQRRLLEELGVERLKMRLDVNVTGPGPNAQVFELKPPILRHQAEEWMVKELKADKRRDDKTKRDTLWWAKAAALASIIVPLVIFLLERLLK